MNRGRTKIIHARKVKSGQVREKGSTVEIKLVAHAKLLIALTHNF